MKGVRNKSMQNLIHNRKKIDYKKQYGINLILLGAFLIIVTVLGSTMESHLRKQSVQTTGDSLAAILKINQESMDLWFKYTSSDIESWTLIPHLQILVEKLLKVSRNRQSLLLSMDLKGLRNFFKLKLKLHDFNGFFIISPDFINIGSMRDANIGQYSLIAEQRLNLLKRCFKGETLFIPPVYSDVPLPDKTGKLKQKQPTMFIATPVQDNNGNVIAVMTVRIDPGINFIRIACLGRLGKTGETCFFDETGRMLTPSRFENQLRAIGLIQKDQTSILNLEMRDPGGNLLEGHIPAIARTDQPLTRLAALTMKNGKCMTIKGYRDYRGVQIIGSMVWDDLLEIGMVSKMDLSEAVHISDKIRLMFVIINTLVVFFGFIFCPSTGKNHG